MALALRLNSRKSVRFDRTTFRYVYLVKLRFDYLFRRSKMKVKTGILHSGIYPITKQHFSV